MKRIPLTQGQYALVDDQDFEELSQFKWYAQWAPCTRSFYAARNVRLPNGKDIGVYMHRHILGLERGDKRQADHTNHNTLDNRHSNIRIVTPSQNRQNNRGKGYSWRKATKKYRAYITVNGVQKHLGCFDTPEEARDAYLDAKHTYHPTAPNLENA